MVLIFGLDTQGPSYGPFVFFNIRFPLNESLKQQNDHISAPEPPIKKIRPLYFLQLLKLKEIKWSYFFDKRLRDRDINIFLFWSEITI